MKAAKILQALNPTEPMYKKKVELLAQLIQNKDGGHIIDSKLLGWASEVGIKTELSCEDKCAWWTCRI